MCVYAPLTCGAVAEGFGMKSSLPFPTACWPFGQRMKSGSCSDWSSVQS